MAQRTTINLDDETEAALAELVKLDGTKTLAIKRSVLEQAKRRRRSRALVEMIEEWEAEEGPISPDHTRWANEVLDRQGVPR